MLVFVQGVKVSVPWNTKDGEQYNNDRRDKMPRRTAVVEEDVVEVQQGAAEIEASDEGSVSVPTLPIQSMELAFTGSTKVATIHEHIMKLTLEELLELPEKLLTAMLSIAMTSRGKSFSMVEDTIKAMVSRQVEEITTPSRRPAAKRGSGQNPGNGVKRRGPGRSKKAVAAPVAKRGPGRPRKNPIS